MHRPAAEQLPLGDVAANVRSVTVEPAQQPKESPEAPVRDMKLAAVHQLSLFDWEGGSNG